MSGRLPEHRVLVPVSLQRWADLTFLHWRVDPALLTPRLPPGLQVQEIDGSAWLGVTPFVMRDVRVPGLPPLPGWSTFPEVNVRTYVRGPDGRDGLWFLRLVCPRRAVVGALRLVGLPYVRGQARVRLRPGGAHYRFSDVGAGGPLDAQVTVGPRLARPDPLTDALTGRWNAWTRVGGRLLRVPVEHEPWPLHDGSVLMRSTPSDLAGVPTPPGQPVVHVSPGVRAGIGPPRLVAPR